MVHKPLSLQLHLIKMMPLKSTISVTDHKNIDKVHSHRPFFSMGMLSLGQMGGPTSKYFMSMLTRNPH
jgi:hypothetical protein